VLAAELREREAADVASTILDIQRNPGMWPVEGDVKGEWRPARLSDVTVLIPTRTSLPQLRAALDQLRQPYRIDTGTLVYDTQEVRDVLAAVRAVDDPTDRLSLVAALRSPLYACSDRDLFTFHDAGGRWDVRSSPPADLPDDHPVVVALAHLGELWRSRWWSGPSDLVDRIVRDRQACMLAFAEGRPGEVWRRLRFLVDQARAFEDAGGSGLRGFVDWAELQRGDAARVHEPMLPELDDDAVRIMTIHGAKGLEFPITILSGMTTRPAARRRGISLVWGDDGRPEVRLSSEVSTLNHDPRADVEATMGDDERKRLLYVACTRARDHLVVSCHHKASVDSFGAVIWRAMHEPAADAIDPPPFRVVTAPPLPFAQIDLRTLDTAMPGVAPIPPTDDEWAADRRAFVEGREAVVGPQRIATTVSATTIAHEVAAVNDGLDLDDWSPDDDDLAPSAPATGDDVDDGPIVVSSESGRPRRRGRLGTAIGRAVHATLEFSDLAAPSVERDAMVAPLALRHARENDVESEAPTVERLVRSALASGAARLAATAPHHKEVYVSAPIGDRVIEGYVDLLVEGPDGLVVVDWKTDSARTDAEIDAKLAAYELQGAAYAIAVEAVTGRVVTECRFVFCRAAGAIERSVVDLPAATQLVLEHLGAGVAATVRAV
jgi:ATP-dependent exoDNAse (exonuclease V) beta subunit